MPTRAQCGQAAPPREKQNFQSSGVAVVLVNRLIYGASVDLADPVAVDRRCDVASSPASCAFGRG